MAIEAAESVGEYSDVSNRHFRLNKPEVIGEYLHDLLFPEAVNEEVSKNSGKVSVYAVSREFETLGTMIGRVIY